MSISVSLMHTPNSQTNGETLGSEGTTGNGETGNGENGNGATTGDDVSTSSSGDVEQNVVVHKIGNVKVPWGLFFWLVIRFLYMNAVYLAIFVLIPLQPISSSSFSANSNYIIFCIIICSLSTMTVPGNLFNAYCPPPSPKILERLPHIIVVCYHYFPSVILGFFGCFFATLIPIWCNAFPVPFLIAGTQLFFNIVVTYSVRYQYPARIRESSEFKDILARSTKPFQATVGSIVFGYIVTVVYLLVGGVGQVFILVSISFSGFLTRYVILYTATKYNVLGTVGPLLLANSVVVQFPTTLIIPRATETYVLVASFFFRAFSSLWPLFIAALFSRRQRNRVQPEGYEKGVTLFWSTTETEAKVCFSNFLCNVMSVFLFVPMVLFYSYGYNKPYSFFQTHNNLGSALGVILGNSVLAVLLFFVVRHLFVKFFRVDPVLVGIEELKKQSFIYTLCAAGNMLGTLMYTIKHCDIYYFVAKDLYS